MPSIHAPIASVRRVLMGYWVRRQHDSTTPAGTLRTPDLGRRTSDLGPRTSDLGPRPASVCLLPCALETAATGLNRPPDVQIGYVVLLPSGNAIDLLGNVWDPDEEGETCGRQYCVSAKAEGACRSAFLQCTCLAGLEAEVTRTAPSGICTVTFTLKDSWGQIGTPVYSFDVANARPSISIKKQ